MPFRLWRSVRVADGARLESVYTLIRIVGSNPTSSDLYQSKILI
jgi:hypothetical protein